MKPNLPRRRQATGHATMIRRVAAITISGLLGTAGCTFNPPPLTLHQVGPEQPDCAATNGSGRLIVYSGWDALADRYRREHSDYKLLSADGAFLRHVLNSYCFEDFDPVPIELPAGRYQVSAMSENTGRVQVPVLICAGQTTYVRLERYDALRRSAFGNRPVVTLPDGQVVGWAASDRSK